MVGNQLSKQRGITLLGFIMVLIVLAIFAVVAMNLFPVYNEAFSVKSSMESVARQPGANDQSLTQLQRSLQKYLDINSVSSVEAKQAELIRDKGGNQLSMVYEVRKPLVYNLDFVAKFDFAVPLSTSSPSGGN
jgi:hypothetical protein